MLQSIRILNFAKTGLTAAVLFACLLHSKAANYYVDYANGADANNGTSTNSPWQHCPGDPSATGNPASAALAPGDTVFFKGGVKYVLTAPYVNSEANPGILVKWSGNPGSPITYDGNSAGNWGTGKATVTDNYGTNFLCAFYSQGNTMSNLNFLNFDIGPIGGGTNLPADNGTKFAPNGLPPNPGGGICTGNTGAMINVLLAGCDFHDLGYYGSTYPLGGNSLRGGAVDCAGCDGLTISNCTFNRMADGVYLNNPNHIANFTFTGCVVGGIEQWALVLITHTNCYLSNVFICNNLWTNVDQNYTNWGGYGSPPHRDTIFSFGDEGCGGSCSVTRSVVDTNVNVFNNYFVDTTFEPGGSCTVWFIDGASVNIYNNVFNNCQSVDGIVSFGGQATNTYAHVGVYNNTFYTLDWQLSITCGGAAVTPKWPVPTNDHTNFYTIENNIIYLFSYGSPNYNAYCYLIQNTADNGTSGFTNNVVFDYNMYSSPHTYQGNMVYGYYQEILGYITTNSCRFANWDNHSVLGNPGFINPTNGNFHLIPASPILATGTNLSGLNLPGLGFDKDGVQRPTNGLPWTMGAYQGAGMATNAALPVVQGVRVVGYY